MKMPSLPSLCFPTVFIQSFLLLSMASLSKGFTVVSGYLPSSQWKCSTHPVTARLSICRFSIRPEQNPVILLRLSLTPRPQEFEARHSHSIIESYSEYHRQGQTFRILLNAAISSSLYHEDSDLTEWLAQLSGEHSVVRRSTMHRVSGIQEIFTQSKVERRWLSVTRSQVRMMMSVTDHHIHQVEEQVISQNKNKRN